MLRFLIRRPRGGATAAPAHRYPCDGITVFCDGPDCPACRTEPERTGVRPGEDGQAGR